jgi:hypothetical protein
LASFFKKLLGRQSLDPNDLQAVVRAYGDVIANKSEVMGDITELPLTKDQIKKALLEAITMTPEGASRGHLKTAFVTLGDFQDLEKCRSKGIDPMKAMVDEAQSLLEELNQIKR